jgi:8-oxo-dGTP pyrophosphatase MutT (NUDIX family)
VDPSTDRFLAEHPPYCEVRDDWPLEPIVPLVARIGLADVLPPPGCRSSVTAVVGRADRQVLFVHPASPTGSIAHVIVGGRPEPDELPEQTIVREVGEETGWLVEPIAVVGYRHFHHLGDGHPQLADRPHPDFVQPVYAAVARRADRDRLLPEEAPAAFVPWEWAVEVTHPVERALLVRALDVIGPST